MPGRAFCQAEYSWDDAAISRARSRKIEVSPNDRIAISALAPSRRRNIYPCHIAYRLHSSIFPDKSRKKHLPEICHEIISVENTNLLC